MDNRNNQQRYLLSVHYAVPPPIIEGPFETDDARDMRAKEIAQSNSYVPIRLYMLNVAPSGNIECIEYAYGFLRNQTVADETEVKNGENYGFPVNES